jgi:hypothetical protein
MSDLYDKVNTMMNKTSCPDWLNDLMTCGCDLPMCPMCDSDFYVDMHREDTCFFPEDDTPPF